MKIIVTLDMMYDCRETPNQMTSMFVNTSSVFYGLISPYPTVHIVTTAQ